MKKITYNNISRHKAASSILCLLALLLYASFPVALFGQHAQNATRSGDLSKPKKEIKATIPSASRFQKNRVFLERADSMMSGPNEDPRRSYILLMGNIEFTRADMHLYCDSAHYYDQINSIDAFGNVRMERADHLTGRADQLHYDGNKELMTLTGSVSIAKDDKVLSSEEIDYHVATNTGSYSTGGRLEDPKNVLTSIIGSYNFSSDDAVFTNNVELVNNRDGYTMHTNRLKYNTRTNIAQIVETTEITSKDNRIVTDNGNYNTVSEESWLYAKNGVQPILYAKDDRTLSGDTIHYNRHNDDGYAKGNVTLVDVKHKAILNGGYGYHSEKTHQSFVTKEALAKIYNEKNAKPGERSDTLFFHGDTITVIQESDSSRLLTATNGVKFYRKDVQGICGYLNFSQRDSILHLYNHPVVWSGERQISSDNQIDVHMRDSSSIDWAYIPNRALMIEYLGEIYYNQLSGKKLKAFFNKNVEYYDDGTEQSRVELRHVDVSGNVKTLFYPMENDSSYNKCVRTESGFLSIDLKAKQEIDKIKLWPEVSGQVIPLYKARNSQLRLDEYQWFDNLRPKSPYEVLSISSDMRDMISQPYEIEVTDDGKNNNIKEISRPEINK